ncbi:MAG: hypothetical protein ACHRHE_11385 [Tepidisphaerales bacterium]
MQRLWEIILGLDKGFLGKEGEFSLQFNPRWPFQDAIGASVWNLVLILLAAVLVFQVYRREGRARWARILLGVLRAALLAFLIALLNRPSLTLTQTRSEPSYLAFVLDDSISMQVRDAGITDDNQGTARFDAAIKLLSDDNQQFLRNLAGKHILKFYTFDRDAQPVATLAPGDLAAGVAATTAPTSQPSKFDQTLADLKPTGQSTQILASLRTVLQDLQGKRVAGVVLLTDGRSSPPETVGDNIKTIQNFGIHIYPVAVGSDKPARNLAIDSIDLQEAAFAKDIVAARVKLRSSGFPKGHTARVLLKNKATGQPLQKSDGKPAEVTVTLDGSGSQDVEVIFKPTEVGTLQLLAEVNREPGEVDYEDNTFPAQIAVLDAKITLLYVDGYPRWEYRYLKNEMIRDKTVEISCLLLSADTGFAQEGNKPITRFPENLSEMLAYDVVLFGDVDPRNFTDAQLQLVNDFVVKKNGGFGMVAGPRWSPYAFRNTPIEAILPISIARTAPDDSAALTVGWRPVLTKDGEQSTIFRFFEDKERNTKFIKEELQPVFWYCRGITAKPGVGEVYAEHPNDLGPDARKAPILVLGRFGGGRTLFSAIDDSWRWRFYTGEAIFDTYWVQQLRYLARARKLGQRQFTLAVMRPSYELGEQTQVSLRLLDPDLQKQLPDQLSVTLVQKNADGSEQAVRQETLQKQEGQTDLYIASWTADKVGQFVARVAALANHGEAADIPVVVKVPRLELVQPDVDRVTILSKLRDRAQNPGDAVDFDKLVLADVTDIPTVRAELAKIPSVAMDVPVFASQLLWNAPLAMVLFVLLITLEWVIRKGFGML